MPAKSAAQQRFMGAAYARKKAGHPRAGDPKMSVSQLRDFASTSTHGLPDRVKPARGYGKGPLA
jgi:hypothetical protein